MKIPIAILLALVMVAGVAVTLGPGMDSERPDAAAFIELGTLMWLAGLLALVLMLVRYRFPQAGAGPLVGLTLVAVLALMGVMAGSRHLLLRAHGLDPIIDYLPWVIAALGLVTMVVTDVLMIRAREPEHVAPGEAAGLPAEKTEKSE